MEETTFQQAESIFRRRARVARRADSGGTRCAPTRGDYGSLFLQLDLHRLNVRHDFQRGTLSLQGFEHLLDSCEAFLIVITFDHWKH